MSLPSIPYSSDLRFYLQPHGAPVVPTKFSTRQQCRTYYHRVKVHVQLSHDGTWQGCQSLLQGFIYHSHQNYFNDVINHYAHPHKQKYCPGCFYCSPDEFWTSYEDASRRASNRYMSLEQDLSPEKMLEKHLKRLRDLERSQDTPKLFEDLLTRVQTTLRQWPSRNTLTRVLRTLSRELPGVQRMLVIQLGSKRVRTGKDGELYVPYGACVPDVIRHVMEVMVDNAEKIREVKMYQIYGMVDQFKLQCKDIRNDSLDTLVDEDEDDNYMDVSTSTVLTKTADLTLSEIQEEQHNTVICLFCGSCNGHIHEDCPLLESLAESHILRLGFDGLITDYNGKRLNFDSVPWCSSQVMFTCLSNRP